MATWLIVLITVFGYIILAGLTGGWAERMGMDDDCVMTLSVFAPIGIIFILIGMIWRFAAGNKIWKY